MRSESDAGGPRSDEDARALFRAWIGREGAAYALYVSNPTDETRLAWLAVLGERPPLYGAHTKPPLYKRRGWKRKRRCVGSKGGWH